ncbi:MAG: prepilin-type N-terminal cleavage/methylation domain-containing protein [Phycisphaerae bacterium]
MPVHGTTPDSTTPPSRSLPSGFTLVELLVVVSILALLVAMLLPSLSGARDQAKAAVCASGIRQIALANTMYAGDHRQRYCPGAADLATTNLHRWHGTRDQPGQPFRAAGGPLVPYLGSEQGIRVCPSLRIGGSDADPAHFERNCGGYGYNQAFLGRVLDPVGFGFFKLVTDRLGAMADRVRRPGQTVMFADAAFAGAKLIEYSFAEPRRFPQFGGRPDPSIHFRHRGGANVAWCDGHVDRRKRTFTWKSGFYPTDPDRLGIGWFGRLDDNSLFDLD